MKSILKALSTVASIAILAASGCSSQYWALEVTTARTFKPDCSTDATLYIASGFIDLGWTSSYIAFFSVANNQAPAPLVVGNSTVSNTSGSDIIISSYHLHYVATPALSIPDADIPVHEVVPVGASSGSNFIFADLMSPSAAATLQAGLGSATSYTVLVTVTFKANLASGPEVNSNDVTFPLTVVSTARATCAPASDGTATVETPTGSCYNPGQDGQTLNCVAPAGP